MVFSFDTQLCSCTCSCSLVEIILRTATVIREARSVSFVTECISAAISCSHVHGLWFACNNERYSACRLSPQQRGTVYCRCGDWNPGRYCKTVILSALFNDAASCWRSYTIDDGWVDEYGELVAVMLTGEDEKCSEKNLPQCHFAQFKFIWTEQGSDQGVGDKRPGDSLPESWNGSKHWHCGV